MGMVSFNFLRTGYYYRINGYILSRYSHGNWWSTAAGSDEYSYNLWSDYIGTLPQHGNYRGAGFAVRCVVREG